MNIEMVDNTKLIVDGDVLLVKQAVENCRGCYFFKLELAKCRALSDVLTANGNPFVQSELGGCKLGDHILIHDEEQSLLDYLIFVTSGEVPEGNDEYGE